MTPNPDDWRDQIAALAGGATLEDMLRWAARQGRASDAPRRRGWTVTVGWFRAPAVYRAKVYRADVARTTEGAHPSDPIIGPPTPRVNRSLLSVSEGCRVRASERGSPT